MIETELATFYVLHDLHALDLDPAAAGFQVVVTGHSHKPASTERDGVLYRESGKRRPAAIRSAGDRRPPGVGPPAVERHVRRILLELDSGK